MYILNQILGVHLSGHVHYQPDVSCSRVRQRTFMFGFQLSGHIHSPPNTWFLPVMSRTFSTNY